MLQAGTIVLTGMSMALTCAALSHTTTTHAACLLQRHCDLSRFELHIVDATLETRVQRQIVRQSIEIGNLMATQIEYGQHIHAVYTARRTTCYVEFAIHGEPSLTTDATHFDLIRYTRRIQPEVNGFLCEYATWSSAKIPSEHYVTLYKANCQMITLLIVITRLAEEGKQRDLRHGLWQYLEAQLQ